MRRRAPGDRTARRNRRRGSSAKEAGTESEGRCKKVRRNRNESHPEINRKEGGGTSTSKEQVVSGEWSLRTQPSGLGTQDNFHRS